MALVLWLALALPAVVAVAVRLAPAGDRALSVAGAAAAAVPAWLLVAGAAGGERASSALTWLPAGGGLEVGLRLDPLSAAMSALVATVGLVVVVYATGYFADSPRRRSALAGLLAFLAAMQGLVLAEGYLALLIFWELVGAASARLIAFERDDPAAGPGAVRAFLTTRTADLGLYLAILALFAAGGGIGFGADRPEGALGAVVGLGLVVAAAGKSAQAPLQTWLMGAMAGPTPVSALLHSATMVAAGVYLLMRSAELLAGWPLELAGWIGAVTAVAAGAIALAQDDLKRVLAGSTASQLGLMFVGLAAGGPIVALFHLVAHAAGKAGMFLATGLFQHRRGSTSLAALAGVGRDERAGFWCFGVCALSIAAVPPLAAFWSKDHVAAAAEHQLAWFLLVLIAAGLAAAYLLRPALVLWRRRPDAPATVGTAGRPAMLAGAGALAAVSVAGGLLGAPLERLLGGHLPSSTASLLLSVVALAAGAGAVLAGLRPSRPLVRLARRQLLSLELQDVLVVRPAQLLARASDASDRRLVDAAVDGTAQAALRLATGSDRVERHGVDAAVDGIARLVGAGGRESRRVQSGRLGEYLRDTVAGAAAVAAVIALAAIF